MFCDPQLFLCVRVNISFHDGKGKAFKSQKRYPNCIKMQITGKREAFPRDTEPSWKMIKSCLNIFHSLSFDYDTQGAWQPKLRMLHPDGSTPAA